MPGGEKIASAIGVDYFSVPVEFGVEGANRALPVGKLTAYEERLLEIAVNELKGNITMGITHVI